MENNDPLGRFLADNDPTQRVIAAGNDYKVGSPLQIEHAHYIAMKHAAKKLEEKGMSRGDIFEKLTELH